MGEVVAVVAEELFFITQTVWAKACLPSTLLNGFFQKSFAWTWYGTC